MRWIFLIAVAWSAIVASYAVAQSAPPPRLFIVSPAPGEVIAGTDVKVIVQLPPAITLVDPQTHTANVEGEGHVHMWLDALSAHDDEVSVALVGTNEYIYHSVFSGLHTLHVALFQNDHTAYPSRFAAAVEFETVGEELKPAPIQGGQSPEPSVGGTGLFLPHESGNTLFGIVLIAVFVALLWYIFERRKRT